MRAARNSRHLAGVTVVETMVSLVALGLIMAAAITGATAIRGVMTTAENYSVGQLATVDYLTLDLRRAIADFAPTVSGSATAATGKLTLPITLGLPQYYAADGKTPTAAKRTLVTTTNKRSDRKKHRVIAARNYYHYGTLGVNVSVEYYVSNGTLFRRETTPRTGLPARVVTRAIGEGIQEVTFSSPDVAANATPEQKLAAIAINPVVSATVSFLPTRRSKKAPPPLSNSTFMREYYYSDY